MKTSNNKNILIVLGGGLDKNEQLPEHSRLRHIKAYEIHRNYDYIICSSKKTYKDIAKNQIKTEAEVGKKFLISLGVPENKILLEEESMDTFSNAYFSRILIDKLFKTEKITVVTSSFHMPKTKFVFSIVFPENKYNLQYIESKNGNVDPILLSNRIKSEMEVINFYKKNLFSTYSIKIGDMESIKNFMEKHNSALTGIKDKYHEELTNKIKQIQEIKNPLY